MTNHLWQSTVFVACVALLAWLLRNHRAGVRYALWFSASLKFFVPFALFMSLGRQAGPAVAPLAPAIPASVRQFTAPFPEVILAGGAPQRIDWMPWILAVWACGVLAIVIMRVRLWHRVRLIVRASRRCPLPFPIEVRTSPGALEPGLVGLWRYTILLPEGIERHLTGQQLDAVRPHDLCHAQRRDTLRPAAHMAVEALFWSHPLVWWIGARLAETRELSCDEAVLQTGRNPRDYADAILNVCKRYVESPLACVSGVTGADLKKRMEAMFSRRVILPLDWSKRALLAASALIAVLAPFLAGVVSAQSSKSFEVVSIHSAANAPRLPGGGGLPKITGTRFEYTGSAYGMIARVFNVSGCRSEDCDFIVGVPPWVKQDTYRIDAKLPEGAPRYDFYQYERGEAKDLYQMIESLLVERFALKVHRQAKEVHVYAMTLGPGGHKLTATAGRTRQYSDGATHVDRQMGIVPVPGPDGVRKFRMSVLNFTAQEIADGLSSYLDRLVLDRTGLSGRFDFTMEFDADPTEPNIMAAVGGPGLLAALREQLGLRLQATKAPVDVLVIDGIERPSEN
jgi:bla regulator protein blaR1